MRATKNGSGKGLNKSMDRSQLIDFIIRISRQLVNNIHSAKEKLTPHIGSIIEVYFESIAKDS